MSGFESEWMKICLQPIFWNFRSMNPSHSSESMIFSVRFPSVDPMPTAQFNRTKYKTCQTGLYNKNKNRSKNDYVFTKRQMFLPKRSLTVQREHFLQWNKLNKTIQRRVRSLQRLTELYIYRFTDVVSSVIASYLVGKTGREVWSVVVKTISGFGRHFCVAWLENGWTRSENPQFSQWSWWWLKA